VSANTWTVATSSPHPLGFWCQRCDARLTYSTRVPLDLYARDGRWFAAAHNTCRPADAEGEQP